MNLNLLRTEDPVSSWGRPSEKTMNASGLTFSVKFLGYVPMPRSLTNLETEAEKDALIKLCVNSVVTCQVSDEFRQAQSQGLVDKFVSLHGLDVFLNVSNLTTTLFHIVQSRSRLLGRYKNNKISRYRTVIIGRHVYLGIVMSNGSEDQLKRECNVLWLGNSKVNDELIEKLTSIDRHDHNSSYRLQSRLKSTQDYGYNVEMLSFFHGNMTHAKAVERFQSRGDFLIRQSETCQDETKVACSYVHSDGSSRKELIPNDFMSWAKNWQASGNFLITPVLKQRDEHF